MRGRLVAWALLLVLLGGMALTVQADPRTPGTPRLAGESNQLENGDFEGSFSARHDPYSGTWAGELEVADGWGLWYDNNQVCPPYDQGCTNPRSYNRRPEYKPEPSTGRVHGGSRSQKFFTTYGTHTAGLYQEVSVPAGSWVRFSIWVWAWSSQKDIPEHSFQPGDYAVTVGIDPTGGTDWRSKDIIWRSALTLHDQWVYLEMDAYTASGEISVWTAGTQVWPVKHNDSYWDDARLVVLAGRPAPTPTETATQTPAPTPQPTAEGYVPPPCNLAWHPLWRDTFEQSMAGWDSDVAKGSVGIQNGALALRNGPQIWEAFPLAWLERPLPPHGDMRLSFRFAFSNPTAYGSSIGVGSQPYHGERTLAGASNPLLDVKLRGQRLPPPGLAAPFDMGTILRERAAALVGGGSPRGIDDILLISHRSTAPGVGEYRIDLLGKTVWTGTPGDGAWHVLELELREYTYILLVDGAEAGRAVSYWRPQSLFVGNPVIVWIKGFWTEVALDDVMLSFCSTRAVLPLLLRAHTVTTHEATATVTPSATVEPSATFTPVAATATPSHTPTPTETEDKGQEATLTPTATMP